VTHILSTDPDGGVPLSLANGEHLPADTYVRRIKEYKKGIIIYHPGISRPIENFRFGKRALIKKDESGLSGFKNQVDSLREIVLKTREELKTIPRNMDTNSDKSSDDDLRNGKEEVDRDMQNTDEDDGDDKEVLTSPRKIV
jgi:hypothetical protein